MIIDQLPALATAGNNDEIAIEVGTTTYKITKSNFLKEFMPKSGGEFTGNITVNGVIDVTPRRCYATLSQEGWYRVMTFSDPSQNETTADGAPSRFISFYITRGYSSNNNEVHKIDYLNPYRNYKFANETSVSNQMIIDKIRSTKSGGNMHIDIHYSASTSNTVSVEFDVHTLQTFQSLYTAVNFTPVAVAPNGETVLTTYSFADNTETQSAVIASANITSTNGTIWGSESYIKLVWDNEKAEISGYVFLQNPASGILKVSVPTPSGFPASKFATNWLIVGQAYRRSGGYMMPCDFCYAIVASSTISIAERNMFSGHPATDYAMITIPSAVYYF